MTTIGKVLIGLGVVGSLSFGGCAALWFGVNDSGLSEQRRRAVALGLPTNPNALNPKPAQNRDAGPELRQLCEELDAWRSVDGKDFNSVWNTVSDSELAKMQSFVRRGMAASRKPELAWGYDYNQGPELLMREYRPIRALVRLLVRDAERYARAQRSVEAFDRLTAAARLSSLVGRSEPNLLLGVVHVSLRQTTIRGVMKLVEELGPTSDTLDRADQVVAAMGEGPNLKAILAGDFAGLGLYMDRMRTGEISRLARAQGDEDARDLGPVDLQWEIPSMRNRMKATFLRTFLDYYGSLPDDPVEIAYDIEPSRRIDAAIEGDESPAMSLAYVLVPLMTPAHEAIARDLAMHRATRCLLTALRTNAQSLPDLGEDSIDPFTRKPLKFVRKGKEIKVYSVGRNLKDDGGDGNKGLDAVARYPIYAEPTNR